MSKYLKSISAVTVVAVMAVVALNAFTNAPSVAAAEIQSVTAHGGGGRGGAGFCGQTGLEAAAKALGLTSDELTTQLWGGATLSSLADKAGVDLQVVQDAVTAACTEATRVAIEQAVTDGTLTRDKADWLLEGLDKGYWGGASGNMGFGVEGGRGFFQSPNAVPTLTPSNNS